MGFCGDRGHLEGGGNLGFGNYRGWAVEEGRTAELLWWFKGNIPPDSLQPLPIDPAPFLRAEKRHHAADIIRHAHAAEGGRRGNHLFRTRMFEGGTREIGFDSARRDHVGIDAPRTEFLRQVPREDLDRAFHRGVGRVAGNRKPGETGGRADDAAAIGDERKQFLREEVDTLEMDVEERIEILLRHFGVWRRRIDARVVDQEIELLPVPLRLQRQAQRRGEIAEAADIPHVQLQHRGFASEFFDLRGHCLRFVLSLAISKHEIRAIARQLCRPYCGPGHGSRR